VNEGDLVEDRFRIEKRIGSGGMGVVYRAHDLNTGKAVALKVIHTTTAEDVLRATREIETLAKFDHSSIVRHIKDGLTTTDQLYVAMEWVDGITVTERLETDGFTLREAVDLAHTVALGLGVAHAVNVVHRDIKPSNIMLVKRDPARAQLIDFGLARVAGGLNKVTRTGITVGTPGYMSPEQARGLRTLGPPSDIFNLGLILYESATGFPAFQGPNLAALMLNICLHDPVKLSLRCPEAPPQLDALIARWLAKNPNRRPKNGLEAAHEIAAIRAFIPDGPRRDAHHLVDGKTRAGDDPVPPSLDSHCLVLASRGFLDDYLDPPSSEELQVVEVAAIAAGGELEVLATGAVAAHFSGNARDVAARAAGFALDIASVMEAWTLAISTTLPEFSDAADEGTALLMRAAKAALFARTKLPQGVTIDPITAGLVEDFFVVTKGRLLARR
jgi:serine/threonine protein kinase